MREKLVIDFTSKYPLQTNRCIGYRGEHNATEVIIIPPNDMKDNNDITYYRVSFGFECRESFSLPYIYKSVVGDAFSIKIPSDVTINPVVSLQLEGYSDKKDLLIKSQSIQGLTFAPSPNTEMPDFEIEPSIKDSIGEAESGIIVLEYNDEGYAKEVLIYGDLPLGISLDSDSQIEKVVMINSTIVPHRMFAGLKNLKTVILPNTISKIEDYAFSNSSISDITIPDSVVSIGERVFYRCENLTEITIPDSVTDIGENSFEECSNLRTITLSQNMTQIKDGLFRNCYNLSSVYNLSNIIYIGDYAFNYCGKLTNISLPATLKTISAYAFNGCSLLTEVELPSSLLWIKESAFSNTNLSRIVIPYGVTKIERGTFSGCYNLSEVIIPSSVISIEDSAFRYCSKLDNITIPSSVISIGQDVFSECTLLKSIIIPDSVTTVGTNAFYTCSNLADVVLSNQLTEISANLFYNCSNLVNITIPNSVTVIKRQAFYGCKSLETIIIPDSVTTIEYNAFIGSGLVTVEIGAGLSQLEYGAFRMCSTLAYIYIKAITPPNLASIEAIPYASENFDAIYVVETEDDSVLNAYKSATNWNDSHIKIKEWGGYLTNTGNDAFILSEEDIDTITNSLEGGTSNE